MNTQLKILSASRAAQLEKQFNEWSKEHPAVTLETALPVHLNKTLYLFVFYRPPK